MTVIDSFTLSKATGSCNIIHICSTYEVAYWQQRKRILNVINTFNNSVSIHSYFIRMFVIPVLLNKREPVVLQWKQITLRQGRCGLNKNNNMFYVDRNI